nr:BLUF domain-containing protein [Oceanobacter mangrovi]
MVGEADSQSAHILNLYNELRVYNVEHAINGVLLVHSEAILLVLEGESHAIAGLVYKVSRDKHLQSLDVIANLRVEQAVFDHWRIKFFLADSAAHISWVKKLCSQYLLNPVINNPDQQALYDSFFPPLAALRSVETATLPSDSKPDLPVTSAPASAFPWSDMTFRITAWPKATQMKMSTQVMQTCSLLSRNEVSYRQLQEKGYWKCETDLQEFLQKMLDFGVLMARQVSPLEGATTAPANRSGGSDRFSALMRRFLTNTRKAG